MSKIKVSLIFAGLLAGLFFAINVYISKESKNLIFSDNITIPKTQVALVLGAKVYPNGVIGDMFRDRIDTAMGLYQAGKVRKILISGDHGRENYDEVNAAKNYLLEKKVREEDIFLDHAGFDTYDSLYRARNIFDAYSLTVVTQDFHLPRAIYIGKNLGLNVYGMKADQHRYAQIYKSIIREKFANIKAWLNVIFRVKPKFLGPEISIKGDGRKSWD